MPLRIEMLPKTDPEISGPSEVHAVLKNAVSGSLNLKNCSFGLQSARRSGTEAAKGLHGYAAIVALQKSAA
jgi:hypothetical protein